MRRTACESEAHIPGNAPPSLLLDRSVAEVAEISEVVGVKMGVGAVAEVVILGAMRVVAMAGI